ncbi:MAG: TatD family hydrolase [Clostridiales bacterium]|nr:TatD family hydrolase [Clostridiales bacterium]
MRLLDAHAHYDDERFGSEYEGGYIKALADAKRAGVDIIINAGSTLESSEKSLKIASHTPGQVELPDGIPEGLPTIFACVGVHPTETQKYPDIDAAIDKVRLMCENPLAVAVGEIGLDYHYPDTQRERQREFFRRQLALARELSLPAVVHSRDATEDTLEILRDFEGERIMLHCFSGSAETAREYSRLGFYFSFGGVLTFKNAKKARLAAASIPRDRLMLETDCPYMAPTPHRGEINSSRYLPITANALGEVLGTDGEDAAALTYENGLTFFDLCGKIRR